MDIVRNQSWMLGTFVFHLWTFITGNICLGERYDFLQGCGEVLDHLDPPHKALKIKRNGVELLEFCWFCPLYLLIITLYANDCY